MSLKRTTKSVYFKQEINTLLLKIIKDTRLASKYKAYQKTKSKKHKSKEYEEPDSLHISY